MKGEARREVRDGREMVSIENVNHPGKPSWADAAMYDAMRRAMLKVLPARAPGLTADETRVAAVAHLPERLYPGGAKSGWWMKAVQLDLEAKGLIVREATKPLRFHRTT